MPILIVTCLLYITTDCTEYDMIKAIQHSVVGSHFVKKKLLSYEPK